jgi:hypothetical protein
MSETSGDLSILRIGTKLGLELLALKAGLSLPSVSYCCARLIAK